LAKVCGERGGPGEDIMIGSTKVFLQESACNWFDKTRSEIAAAAIASLYRGKQTRRAYLHKKFSAIRLQALFRGLVARRTYGAELALRQKAILQELQHKAAAKLQRRRSAAARKVQRCWRATGRLEKAEEPQAASLRMQSRTRPNHLFEQEIDVPHNNIVSPTTGLRLGIWVASVLSREVPGPPTSPKMVEVVRITPKNEKIWISEDQLMKSKPHGQAALVSPRGQCLKECNRLSMEHQKLSKNLPTEHLGLLSALVQDTDFLTNNANPPIQRLNDIQKRNLHFEDVLRKYSGPRFPKGAPAAGVVTQADCRARSLQRQVSGWIPPYSQFSYGPAIEYRSPHELPRSSSAHTVIRAQSPSPMMSGRHIVHFRPATTRTSSVKSFRPPTRTVVSTTTTTTYNTPRTLTPSYTAVAVPSTVTAVTVVPSTKQWIFQPQAPIATVTQKVGSSVSATALPEAVVARLVTPARSKAGAPPPTVRAMSPSPAQSHRSMPGSQNALQFASSTSYVPVASPVLGSQVTRTWSGQTPRSSPQTSPWGSLGPATFMVSQI